MRRSFSLRSSTARALSAALIVTSCSSSSTDDPNGANSDQALEIASADEPSDDVDRGADALGNEESELVDGATGGIEFDAWRFESTSVMLVDGTQRDDDPVPTSVEALLESGIELGVWTEFQGLEAMLEVLVGERSAATINGFAEVVSPSYSGLAEAALELLDSGSLDDEQAARLQQLFDNVVPPVEMLEALSEPSTKTFESGAVIDVTPVVGDELQDDQPIRPTGFARGVSSARTDVGPLATVEVPSLLSGCSFGDAAKFDSLVGVPCWARADRNVVDGEVRYRIRVYYPHEWDGPQGTSDEEILVNAIFDDVERTVATFLEWERVAGRTPTMTNIDIAFSLENPPTVPGLDDEFAIALPGSSSKPCRITVHPRAAEAGGDRFRQILVHEAVHCVQTILSAAGYPPNSAWIIEGGAEYFSHYLVPTGGVEQTFVQVFNRDSLDKPLQTMSYEVWVWWQYMANQITPREVWELHRRLIAGGQLADEVGIEERFHNFVVLWAGPGVRDSAGRLLPEQPPRLSDRRLMDAEGVQGWDSSPWVATRLVFDYEIERRFLQEDVSGNGLTVSAALLRESRSPAAWTELPTEIRSSCSEIREYVIVPTTILDDPPKFEVDVTQVDVAPCDPCLVGTWRLDLQTFEDAVRDIGLTGEMGLEVEVSGDDFLRFGDEGLLQAWRVAFMLAFTGQGARIEYITDAIERGEYTGDGSEMMLMDLIAIDQRLVTNTPVGSMFQDESTTRASFGGFEFEAEGLGPDDPLTVGLDYVCTDVDLVLTAPGQGSVTYDRVEDIPDPPSVIVDDSVAGD